MSDLGSGLLAKVGLTGGAASSTVFLILPEGLLAVTLPPRAAEPEKARETQIGNADLACPGISWAQGK